MNQDDPIQRHILEAPVSANRRHVCRSCFDFFIVHEIVESTDQCHACRSPSPRRPGELDAIRRFWIRNPTYRHIQAFERWRCEDELSEASRNLERFRKRSVRRWSKPEGT